MRSIMLPLICAALLPFRAFGEDRGKKHPIDVKVEQAEEKANSTVEQREAQEYALKLWDDEMNRVYAKLRKALKPAAASALQAAQREWLKYRDSQRKFLDEMYQEFDGTMFIPMHAAAVAEITRERALTLTRLLARQEEFAE